ncbi:mannose-P-dolichol utilization defect 1a [Brachyhypopomus gauderio]|uniref:mannose-P-dolichol utilization defect 1a n=1 Tax=Brachyhypopomus gauderio TaxID=698409 RepID=UPI0040415184
MDTSEEQISLLKSFLLSYLMPEKCYDYFFHHLNFTHVPCLKILLSKIMGFCIMWTLLAPMAQIWKLLWAGRSEGVSLVSALLDMLVVSAHVTFCIHQKFPIGAWGESVFILIQYAVVTFLIQYYRGNGIAGALVLTAYGGFICLLASPLTSQTIIRAAWEWNVLMVIASRLTQVACNHSSGYTGQLSGLYVFLMFLGSLGRMYNSIQETGHSPRTQAWLLAVCCSGLLLVQVVLFRKGQLVPGEGDQQEKRKRMKTKKN